VELSTALATMPHFPVVPPGRVLDVVSCMSSYITKLSSFLSPGRKPGVAAVVLTVDVDVEEFFVLVIITPSGTGTGSAVDDVPFAADVTARVDVTTDAPTIEDFVFDVDAVDDVVTRGVEARMVVAAVGMDRPLKVGRAMTEVKLAWVRPNCWGVKFKSFTRL
jgi:hypothetical protein